MTEKELSMTPKVTVVARTVEAPIEGIVKNEVKFDTDSMRNEAIILSGKAAGICYMPDDYLSNGIQNDKTAKKRAAGNTKSGHYSVFEHAHFSFVVETSKAMAMVLNSTKLYSTSEKSGRYTSMNPETEIEKKYYDKWTEKITGIIKDTYGESYTDKEAHKLALENARYFLSVFTPTVMMFTVPFSRIILICEWLDNLANTIDEMIYKQIIRSSEKTKYNYFTRLSKEAVELSDAFRESLGLSAEEPILVDHKDIGIKFFEPVYEYEREAFICGCLHNYRCNNISYGKYRNDISNDMYSLYNTYSFACLAQEQRHRTIDYSIVNIMEESFYTPAILTKEEDIVEWKSDMKDMYLHSNVVPQATMCFVHESGSFDNFYLKCKERVCMRAQKEIMDITVEQIKFIYKETSTNINNNVFLDLSPLNAARLYSMIEKFGEDGVLCKDPLVLPRCMWRGYKCKEVCTHVKHDCTESRRI